MAHPYGDLRRWRLLEPGGNVGCWQCWRCSPPPRSARVDILGVARGEPRTLLDLPAESLNEQLFTHELAEFGARLAINLRPLPCRCRASTPRAGQRSAA
jgi:hypothetical protein